MYRMIHEHLQYVLMIWNFLYTIRYISYDTDNYVYLYCNNYNNKYNFGNYLSMAKVFFPIQMHLKHPYLSLSLSLL